MPPIAFKCPAKYLGRDEVPIPECLAHAKDLWRRCDWNHALLAAMVYDPRADSRISPTRLQNCPRQTALKRRYDYTLDPANEYFKIRGTLFHDGLEKLFGEGNELELERPLDGYAINGRLDRLDGGAVVVDWKTKNYVRLQDGKAKDGSVIEKFAPPEEHEAQISIYGWLGQPYLASMWPGRETVMEWGELMYMTMTSVTRFIVRLWSHDKVEEYLRLRIPALLAAYDEGAPLAPPLENRDAPVKAPKGEPKQDWRCGSCPVLKKCRELD